MQQETRTTAAATSAAAKSAFAPAVTLDFAGFGLAPDLAAWLAPQMPRFTRLADRATDALCASAFHRELGSTAAPTPQDAAIALAIALGHVLAGFTEAAPREDLRLICDALTRAQIAAELEARNRIARATAMLTEMAGGK